MEANIPGGTAFLKQLFQNLIFIPSHTGCNAAKCHMFPYAIFKMVDAKTCLYLQSLSMKHIETTTEQTWIVILIVYWCNFASFYSISAMF